MRYVAFSIHEPTCTQTIYWFHALNVEDGNWFTSAADDGILVHPFMDMSGYRHRSLWVENVFVPVDPSTGPETRRHYFERQKNASNIYIAFKSISEDRNQHDVSIQFLFPHMYLLKQKYSIISIWTTLV